MPVRRYRGRRADFHVKGGAGCGQYFSGQITETIILSQTNATKQVSRELLGYYLKKKPIEGDNYVYCQTRCLGGN